MLCIALVGAFHFTTVRTQNILLYSSIRIHEVYVRYRTLKYGTTLRKRVSQAEIYTSKAKKIRRESLHAAPISRYEIQASCCFLPLFRTTACCLLYEYYTGRERYCFWRSYVALAVPIEDWGHTHPPRWEIRRVLFCCRMRPADWWCTQAAYN